MTAAKLRLAQAGLANRDTNMSALCKELGLSRQTLYRFVSPRGELPPDALRLLGSV
jgi:DNA-binding phage protein